MSQKKKKKKKRTTKLILIAHKLRPILKSSHNPGYFLLQGCLPVIGEEVLRVIKKKKQCVNFKKPSQRGKKKLVNTP
jgi:hypothetical protein